MRHPVRWLVGLVSAFLVSNKVVAQTNCNGVYLKDVTGNYSFNSGAAPALTFRVARGNSSACNYFVGFSTGWSLSYNPRGMYTWYQYYPYNIYVDSGRTRIIKEAGVSTSSSDFIVGSFPSGSPSLTSNLHTYYMKLLPDPVGVDSGNYLDVVTMILYEGTPGGSYRTIQAWNLVHTYYVNANTHISLVDSGAPFNINDTSQTLQFGTLTPGASRGFDLIAVYNAGYRIYASSMNNGGLKHSNNSTIIPYSFKVGTQTKNLSGSASNPVLIAEGSGQSSSAGTRHAVNVSIGNFSQALAGSYADVITLTVESKE